MSLYATAVKKPVTTALVFVAIVIFGLFSLTRLSVDLLPEIETNTIMVMTSYAGASAADIEMNVSKPLENVLNSVSDLKHITSQSRENISIITLEFDYGTDIDVATNDVRDKLDVAEPMLPDDVDNPIIFKFGTNDIPIIILSAKSEDTDKILGLNIGADDYICKPFNPLELVARVKSNLRRYTSLGSLTGENKAIYQVGGLILNDDIKQVTVDDEPVKMTPIEYNILLLLMKNQGRVFSINQIYESIWNEDAIGADNTVAVHIRHIREKIEINPKEPRYLKVVWGVGYKIDKEQA